MQTQSLLTDRCLHRRAKVLPADSLFSIVDAPLYDPYLNDIVSSGAKILLRLRWNNYVVVSCDSSVALALRNKSYVSRVTSTGEFLQLQSMPNADSAHRAFLGKALSDSACGSFRYGRSYLQNHMLGADSLHALGEIGSNAFVGILDNGFRYRDHDCFNQLQVRAEYDFINQDSLTANDSLDVPSQDGHGTSTLSVLAGFLQDSLIGIAPGIEVMLAKTEDMRSEGHIEEDNFAAAMEWLEAAGVDVTSSSVGYRNLDSTQQSYDYSMLDGQSTICDRAINRATYLGVICCTAAGNEGGSSRTLITPGDADSAITVGAYADDSLHIPDWTSKGPNARNILKPDVATLGQDVAIASLTGRSDIAAGKGTSFATPALAGAVALLVSQFPDLTPWQVRQLLYKHGSRALNPDSISGYGLVNFMELATDYGIVVSPLISYAGPSEQLFVYDIRSNSPINTAQLSLSSDGQHFDEYMMQNGTHPGQFVYRWSATGDTVLYYYLTVRDANRVRRVPSAGFASLHVGDAQLPCGMNADDFPSSVSEITDSPILLPTAIAVGTPQIRIEHCPEGSTLRCFDAVGRLMSTTQEHNGTVILGSSGFLPGLYTIELRSLGGWSAQTLLVY